MKNRVRKNKKNVKHKKIRRREKVFAEGNKSVTPRKKHNKRRRRNAVKAREKIAVW